MIFKISITHGEKIILYFIYDICLNSKIWCILLWCTCQVYEGIYPNAYVPTQHFTLKY